MDFNYNRNLQDLAVQISENNEISEYLTDINNISLGTKLSSIVPGDIVTFDGIGYNEEIFKVRKAVGNELVFGIISTVPTWNGNYFKADIKLHGLIFEASSTSNFSIGSFVEYDLGATGYNNLPAIKSGDEFQVLDRFEQSNLNADIYTCFVNTVDSSGDNIINGHTIEFYDENNQYGLGDLVIYNNNIYYCTSSTEKGEFDPTKWQVLGLTGINFRMGLANGTWEHIETNITDIDIPFADKGTYIDLIPFKDLVSTDELGNLKMDIGALNLFMQARSYNNYIHMEGSSRVSDYLNFKFENWNNPLQLYYTIGTSPPAQKLRIQIPTGPSGSMIILNGGTTFYDNIDNTYYNWNRDTKILTFKTGVKFAGIDYNGGWNNATDRDEFGAQTLIGTYSFDDIGVVRAESDTVKVDNGTINVKTNKPIPGNTNNKIATLDDLGDLATGVESVSGSNGILADPTTGDVELELVLDKDTNNKLEINTNGLNYPGVDLLVGNDPTGWIRNEHALKDIILPFASNVKYNTSNPLKIINLIPSNSLTGLKLDLSQLKTLADKISTYTVNDQFIFKFGDNTNTNVLKIVSNNAQGYDIRIDINTSTGVSIYNSQVGIWNQNISTQSLWEFDDSTTLLTFKTCKFNSFNVYGAYSIYQTDINSIVFVGDMEYSNIGIINPVSKSIAFDNGKIESKLSAEDGNKLSIEDDGLYAKGFDWYNFNTEGHIIQTTVNNVDGVDEWVPPDEMDQHKFKSFSFLYNYLADIGFNQMNKLYINVEATTQDYVFYHATDPFYEQFWNVNLSSYKNIIIKGIKDTAGKRPAFVSGVAGGTSYVDCNLHFETCAFRFDHNGNNFDGSEYEYFIITLNSRIVWYDCTFGITVAPSSAVKKNVMFRVGTGTYDFVECNFRLHDVVDTIWTGDYQAVINIEAAEIDGYSVMQYATRNNKMNIFVSDAIQDETTGLEVDFCGTSNATAACKTFALNNSNNFGYYRPVAQAPQPTTLDSPEDTIVIHQNSYEIEADVKYPLISPVNKDDDIAMVIEEEVWTPKPIVTGIKAGSGISIDKATGEVTVSNTKQYTGSNGIRVDGNDISAITRVGANATNPLATINDLSGISIGVEQILAGQNIWLDPVDGKGAVQINTKTYSGMNGISVVDVPNFEHNKAITVRTNQDVTSSNPIATMTDLGQYRTQIEADFALRYADLDMRIDVLDGEMDHTVQGLDNGRFINIVSKPYQNYEVNCTITGSNGIKIDNNGVVSTNSNKVVSDDNRLATMDDVGPNYCTGDNITIVKSGDCTTINALSNFDDLVEAAITYYKENG